MLIILFHDFQGSSSVKDLEQVMSKHLPGREADHVPSSLGPSGIDFSADSLLRQQPGSRAGSAIQWVGPGQSGPGLPVSALLRQLCASRESVIRANVQVRKVYSNKLQRRIFNNFLFSSLGCRSSSCSRSPRSKFLLP